MIATRNGIPVALTLTAASVHDSQALLPLIQRIPRGFPRRGSTLYGDKGYDSRRLRASLQRRGVRPRFCRREYQNQPSPARKNERIQQTRARIEPIFSWLNNGFHRLRIRLERKSTHYEAFCQFACFLICVRRGL